MTAQARPRLLVLASTYPRWAGDPEPGFVHELCKRLARWFDVRVVCPHASGAAETEVLDGVTITRYRYAPDRWESLVHGGGMMANLRRGRWRLLLIPSFFLSGLLRSAMVGRQWRPDVVHAHWLVPQGLIMALLARVVFQTTPWLCTSHGADLFTLRRFPFVAIKRWVAKAANGITVVSPAMVDALARLAPGTKARVLPMGVDLQERFTPDRSQARSADELLFVGRLVEKKGLRFLISALPYILAERPATRLTIAGFGPEEQALRDQAAQLGLSQRVDFLGAVPQVELPHLYRRAAVFVAPFVEAASGDQEGLGLVSVEAIGCGCPVLVGDVAATLELPAARVDARNEAAMAEMVLSLLRRSPAEAERQAAQARQMVLERFDWGSIAAAYRDTLLSLPRRRESRSP
jgi:glycosyltransferase involved in cell wall biosynthesis